MNFLCLKRPTFSIASGKGNNQCEHFNDGTLFVCKTVFISETQTQGLRTKEETIGFAAKTIN